MKKAIALIAMISLATSSPTQAFWPFTAWTEEKPKMTSYEATMAMRQALNHDTLTVEELDRLVKNGADINFEFSGNYYNNGTLLDIAYARNLPTATKMLESKGAKVTHEALMPTIAHLLSIDVSEMQPYEARMVKAYGAREEVKLPATVQKMIVEEQVKASEQCKKLKEKRPCMKAEMLAFVQKALITDKEPKKAQISTISLQVAQPVPAKK